MCVNSWSAFASEVLVECLELTAHLLYHHPLSHC